jgi:PAS domain S-box-containing protein
MSAARALAGDEPLLNAILETSNDAVFVQRADATIASWNPAAERLFGCAASEILGQSCVPLFAAHLRDEVEQLLAAARAGDRIAQYESEVVRADGMPVPISLSVTPVHGAPDGSNASYAPVRLVLVARDLTEQRIAQASLAEIDARICESEALAHVGSWLWDLRTGAVQWSDEFHRIHGIDPLDFGGTFDAHVEAIHDDDRLRVRTKMEAAVASAHAFEDQYRVVRPDHDVREIYVRGHPAAGSAGSVVGLRGIGQDVTGKRI